MNSEIREQKRIMRQLMRQRIREQSLFDKKMASEQCVIRLLKLSIWAQAKQIVGYAPMPIELDIWPALIKAKETGKSVCLPRYISDQDEYELCTVNNLTSEIVAGLRGIREPLPSCEKCITNHLDLILIPGIAFDRHGRRLGRGKGYYDRLLAQKAGVKCGIAFDYQICEALPVESHDYILDCILTPTRWFVAGCETVIK